MNALNLLYNFVFLLLGGLIVYAFRTYLVSYSAKKGENLATKEDIHELTRIVEEVKTDVSGDEWDRKRRWEMRRDVVDEAVRTVGELELTLFDLQTYYSITVPEREDVKAKALSRQQEARDHFDLCSQKYYRVMFSVDLVAGEALQKCLSGYFQHVGHIALQILNGGASVCLEPETKQALTNETWKIIRTAREVLNIENAE
jgi:hypothetical protein